MESIASSHIENNPNLTITVDGKTIAVDVVRKIQTAFDRNTAFRASRGLPDELPALRENIPSYIVRHCITGVEEVPLAVETIQPETLVL